VSIVNIREKIIQVIKKHPEGLTMTEIAKLVGMSRLSISKYIYELHGAKKIRIRRIGKIKLCYLNKKRR